MPKGAPAPWYRRSRKSWFVTIGGKQIDLQTRDRHEAYRRWHELVLHPEPAAPAVPQLTVRELCAQFLEWAEHHRRPACYDLYVYFLRGFAATIPAALLATDLRPFRVTQWVDRRRQWGTNSRRTAMATVKRAFQWAVQEGYLPYSPIAALKKPSGERRESVLSPEQRALIINGARDQCFREFLVLLQETGARPQEVRAVAGRHVDVVRRLWVFPPEEHKTGRKTGRPRVVYLTPTAWSLTERLMTEFPDGPLCRNRYRRPWTSNAIRCRFRRLREDLAGQIPDDLCAYLFRHSFATDALERGVDAITVAELLGHRDVAMLSRVYQHLGQRVDHLRAAACRATEKPAE